MEIILIIGSWILKVLLGLVVAIVALAVLSVIVFFLSRAGTLGVYAGKQRLAELKQKKEEETDE